MKDAHRRADSSCVVHEANCLAPNFADLVSDFLISAINRVESIVLVVCYQDKSVHDIN